MRAFLLALAVAVAGLAAGCAKATDEEMMQQAIDLQKQAKYDASLAAFQELTTVYPKSPRVPEALYAMAHLYQNEKKEFAKAIELHRRIVKDYPQHATASSSSFLIGFIYNNELQDTAAARVAYTEYIQKYPGTPMVSSAAFELQTLGKDPATALAERSQPAAPPKRRTKGR